MAMKPLLILSCPASLIRHEFHTALRPQLTTGRVVRLCNSHRMSGIRLLLHSERVSVCVLLPGKDSVRTPYTVVVIIGLWAQGWAVRKLDLRSAVLGAFAFGV